MSDYAATCLMFERNGDKLFPVLFRKEWIGNDKDRRFGIVNIKTIAWSDFRSKVMELPDWTSNTMHIKASTRAELIANGTIKPAGHGMPCLMILPSAHCA